MGIKNFIVALIVAFCTTAPGLALGQTKTPNLGLTLPPAVPGTWGADYNNNFTIIDNSSATSLLCTAGQIQQSTGTGWACADATAGSFAADVAFSGDITPAQITADQNNYDPTGLSTAATLRLATDASRNITGLAGGTDGRMILVHNVGAQNLVLINESGLSTDINRFAINADITLAANQGLILQYDSTTQRWRAASGISGGAGQAADNDLTAVAGLGCTGLSVRTATDTWNCRTMATADANNITIADPTGAAGNPTWGIGPNVALTTRSFTVTTGDWDFGAGSSFTVPKAIGAAPTLDGRLATNTSDHRLKYGFNGSTVTLAHLSEVQGLNSNLTALSGLTGASATIPRFTGAGTMSILALPTCADTGGNHYNFDGTSFICGTSTSGALSGGTTGTILKYASATTATDSILTEAGGTVTVGGGLIVGATPYLILDTSAIAASDKTWTILNFSGTVRPSTGALTPGNIVTTNADGLLVDGGAAGVGTWTDSSTSTGTNKTIDVEGTGNVITTVQKIWLPAAGGTVAAPGLLWDANTVAPTAVCTAGTTNTGLVRCTADFADSDGDYALQQAIALPSDWTGAIDAKIKWRTATANAGLNVVWQVATLCRADAEVDDAAWNAASTATDAGKGTTNQLNDATITGVTATGCAAGELMHVQILRNRTHASDTMTGVVSLVGVELTTRRAQ